METIPPLRSHKTTRSDSNGYVEKQSKKHKKWSIGGLFRRKKKVSDTDSSSSSEDADKKGFLNRRRSIRTWRNRSKEFTERAMLNYPVRHNADVVRFEQSECTDISEFVPVSSYNQHLSKTHHKSSNYTRRSLEDVGHEGVRTQIKGRMERSGKERLRVESSSDEAESSVQSKGVKARWRDSSLSLRSRTSRTERYKRRVLRHAESLRDTHEGPSSRTSRSFEVSPDMRSNEKASPNNQWTADIVYYESSDYETKYTAKMKSASSSPVQSPGARHKNALCRTSSPTPSSIFVSTYSRDEEAVSNSDLSYSYYSQPVNHGKQKPRQRCVHTIPPRLPKSNSDVIFRESPLSRLKHTTNEPNNSNIIISPPLKQQKKQIPPRPPPRDPLRKVIISNDTNNKISAYANFNECDKNTKQLNYTEYPEFGSSDSAFRRVHLSPQAKHMDILACNESHVSNSDHSIFTEKELTCTPPLTYQKSVTVYPETSEAVRINDCEAVAANTRSESILGKVPNQYHYLTDQPRSRKPIHIACKTNQLSNECYLSDSQVATIKDHSVTQSSASLTKSEEVLNGRDFWILNDQKRSGKSYSSEDSSNIKTSHFENSTTMDGWSISPYAYAHEGLNDEHPTELNPVKREDWSVLDTSHSPLRDVSRIPHSERLTHNDIPAESPIFNDNAKRDYKSMSITNQSPPHSSESKMSPIAKFTHLSPTDQNRTYFKINSASEFEHCDEDHEKINSDQNRKNVNSLEDALNELEAIYMSLKLDDDKYFENDGNVQTEYNKDSLDDPNWNEGVNSTGVQSDLSYKYSKSALESADNIVPSNKRSNNRRSETPNRVTDDMAYRRLIKNERPPPQEKEVISQAGSFLLVSPTLSPPPFFKLSNPLQVNKEPDITYDDVVYRNIQHTNNAFKILDPQPPFGIPLLPVTPAPNSSYLCVNSKEIYRPTFKPKKYPDIVADDLAYRNLRKDKNKEQLSKFNAEQDQTQKSTVHGTLVEPQKIRKKNRQKDFIAPFSRRSTYNNNNLEEDLDELQSSVEVTDTNKVSGFVPKAQYAKPVMLETIINNCKNRLSAEDSNTSPQIPTCFSPGISWLSSSKTVTEGTMSAPTQDSKQAIYNAHEVDTKLPVYNSLVRSESLGIKNVDTKTVVSVHQTLDNETFAHSTSIFDSPLTLINDLNNKNDILANCDLYEELNELNDLKGVTKRTTNDFKEHDSKKRSYTKEGSTVQAQSNSHDFHKVETCNMIKHNKLCIYEDEKLENKPPAITNSTTGAEMIQSLAALCLELDESPDFYSGEYNQDWKKEHCSNNENSASNNSEKEIPNHCVTNETSGLKGSVSAIELPTNYEFEVLETSPLPCSEVNILAVAKPIVFSLNGDSEISMKSCQSLSQDSEEERVNIASNPLLCTAMSDEGTKENCVPACNQHTNLLCMIWLHQLASLDLLTILSVILAIATLILVAIL